MNKEKQRIAKTAHFEYKCRRCGIITLNPHMGVTDGETQATIQLLNAMSGITEYSQSPKMLSLHSCSDSECGVSDLIGYHITAE